MNRAIRIAALAGTLLMVAACQPLREQKDEVVQTVAAILISPVIDAQSADARQKPEEVAKPAETCRSAAPLGSRTSMRRVS
jgi:hypothetical protein